MTKKRSTDIRTCPVCRHPVKRSDMQFTRDCNGIPFRLVCWDCYDQLMAKGYDGEYYVMECYGLGFSEMEWGTCRMLLLKDGEEGKPLNYEEIVKREIDMEKFRKHLADFNAGIMPGQGEDQSKQRESKVQHKEFGWLSPEGTFTESPFGTHEESAEMICERKGFADEYWKWVKENGDNEIGHLMRDFLSEVKGYCLIHNPTGCGGYIVTNMKSLTKRQKEFLYGYFMDMGDRFKAEQFIKE